MSGSQFPRYGSTGRRPRQVTIRAVVALAAGTALLVAAAVQTSAAASAGTVRATVRAAAPAAIPSRPVVTRDGTWLLRDSLTTGTATTTFSFGSAGDFPVSGDWDGDGVATAGMVRLNTWSLRNSSSTGPAELTFSYGSAGDVPIVGDWDGDGIDTPGVVRGNTWYLRNSSTTGPADVTFQYGSASDQVLVGDWDGDGVDTPGVVRGSTWYERNANSAGPSATSFGYGRAGDRPVAGDWDGNRTTTPGRLRDGRWLLRNSNTAGVVEITFGYGSAYDLAQASTGALTTERGAKPLKASLRGTELTKLPTTAKVVALTFDAGGDAAGVPKVLAALQAAGVPATFFLTGSWVNVYPAQSRALGLRYPIGNHTYSHPDLTTLTDSQVRSQVTTGGTVILRQTRYDQRPLFRFPYGARDARTIALVNGLGYASVRWTVDTLGWKGTSGGQSTSTVVSRVLAGLTPGEIVLMHVGSNPDDHSTLDADALPTLISQLRARGYTLVTVPPYL